MTSKEKLYKLLYLAFIEIRGESNDKDRKIFEISNLLHNLPLKLSKDEPNFDLLLEEIFENSKNNKGLNEWIESNIKNK